MQVYLLIVNYKQHKYFFFTVIIKNNKLFFLNYFFKDIYKLLTTVINLNLFKPYKFNQVLQPNELSLSICNINDHSYNWSCIHGYWYYLISVYTYLNTYDRI